MSGLIDSAGSKSGIIGDPALYWFGHMTANMTSSGIPQWTEDGSTISENTMASGVYTVNKTGIYQVNCIAHYKTTTTSGHYFGQKIHRTEPGQSTFTIAFGGYLGDSQTVQNTNSCSLQQTRRFNSGDTFHPYFEISGTTCYGATSVAWSSTMLYISYVGE